MLKTDNTTMLKNPLQDSALVRHDDEWTKLTNYPLIQIEALHGTIRRKGYMKNGFFHYRIKGGAEIITLIYKIIRLI